MKKKFIYGSISILAIALNGYADEADKESKKAASSATPSVAMATESEKPAVAKSEDSAKSESPATPEPEGSTNDSSTPDAVLAAMLSLSPTGYDDELDKILNEIKRLQLEKTKLELQHEMALLSIQQEKDRLLLENDLRTEQNREKLAELTAQKDKATLENELHTAQEQQQLANLSAAKARIELENGLEEQRRLQKLSPIELEKARLELQNIVQAERNKQESMQIELETTKLNFELAKVEFEKTKQTANIDVLVNKLTEKSVKEEWDNQVDKDVEYLKEPFIDGHLVISDRRIFLDGPIWREYGEEQSIADYIVEQIHYYNNKSEEYPIFLVIGSSPGGTVMEGLKIVKAMEKSRAPVYVVVQAFAASMTAVITSLAERSFAYPNAIILHHQVWGISWGNVVQQKEQLEFMEEWNRRTVQLVGQKMGLTLDEFVEQMYVHNSEGDWLEFAEEAAKIKWIDYVVSDIRDESYIRKPQEEDIGVIELDLITGQKKKLEEKIDSQGARYVQVPHLIAPDVYHLYNPDNYYRY